MLSRVQSPVAHLYVWILQPIFYLFAQIPPFVLICSVFELPMNLLFDLSQQRICLHSAVFEVSSDTPHLRGFVLGAAAQLAPAALCLGLL